MTLFLLFVFLVILVYFIYKIHKPNIIVLPIDSVSDVQDPNPLFSPSIGLGTIATRPGGLRSDNILEDPYTAPLKTNGTYFRSDSSDVRNMIPPAPVVRVNMRTRGYEANFNQVGILTRSSGNDALILPLMGRITMTGRDKWQYYSISNTGVVNTKLPIIAKKRSCTNEYGCDELMSGDEVYVEGYKEEFKVTIYDNGSFSYIPY